MRALWMTRQRRCLLALSATPAATGNLELSAQRALTVTRALIDEGMPSQRVFAAAFGAEQPVAANTSEQGRAKNRRVEMAPVARTAPAKPAS